MSEPIDPPEIVVRVPGPWLGPDDFDSRLPMGYKLGGDDEVELWLSTPDGQRLGVTIFPADDEFLEIFATSCKREPCDADKRGVETYRFNICLTMPGGSFTCAAAALRHTAALLDAGGHGVFVDNSGIAHGSNDWRDLAGDSEPDGGGPFWAFLVTAGSTKEVWTTGMHCLGYRDAIMPRTGDDRLDDFQIRNFLAYSYRSGAVIEEGHVAGAMLGGDSAHAQNVTPMFRIHLEDDTIVPAGHPMHNPYGRYRLAPYEQGPTVGMN
ncbi:MAG: hypothetical protein WD042_06035 [Phycisphaeraceae bacterium]